MLVLSRKPLEIIQIGDNVVVKVLSIRGKQVRFGIDAPAEIPVHRTELIDAMAAPSSCPVPITNFPNELLS
jgi:carbon storage regulator